MIKVPLEVHARISIYALGAVEPEGPTDDLCVALYLNDQEAAELSLKALVDDHLSSVVEFAESPEELMREATRFRALAKCFSAAADKTEKAAKEFPQ
jgi:hypothetical protein